LRSGFESELAAFEEDFEEATQTEHLEIGKVTLYSIFYALD
jgi:hypothetical protein